MTELNGCPPSPVRFQENKSRWCYGRRNTMSEEYYLRTAARIGMGSVGGFRHAASRFYAELEVFSLTRNKVVDELFYCYAPGSVPHSLALFIMERVRREIQPDGMKRVVDHYLLQVYVSQTKNNTMTVEHLVIITEHVHRLRDIIRSNTIFFLVIRADARKQIGC
eukprot:IDg8406t1